MSRSDSDLTRVDLCALLRDIIALYPSNTKNELSRVTLSLTQNIGAAHA